jgi:hypothetical protein
MAKQKSQTIVLTVAKDKEYLHFKSINRLGRSKAIQNLWKHLKDGDIVDLIIEVKKVNSNSIHNLVTRSTTRNVDGHDSWSNKFACLHNWYLVNSLSDEHNSVVANLLICELCGYPKIIGRPRRQHSSILSGFRYETSKRSYALSLISRLKEEKRQNGESNR